VDAEGAVKRVCPTIEHCSTHPKVANILGLLRAHTCALPTILCKPNDHIFCKDGRGASYCCGTNQIVLCHERPWSSCDDVAYELVHALNVCKDITCHGGGYDIDGKDCGFLDAEGLACTELRASLFAACQISPTCSTASEQEECMNYYATWALNANFPGESSHTEETIRRTKRWCHFQSDL
jgi:hypothetical protein